MKNANPDPATWAEAVRAGEKTLDEVAESARHCRACELWTRAIQTVFERGSPRARVMLVGEQVAEVLLRRERKHPAEVEAR